MRRKMVAGVLAGLFVILVLLGIGLTATSSIVLNPDNPAVVVVRLDDVQDFAFRDAQLFLFEFSRQNRVPFSLAIIPEYFGEDQKIVDTVKETILCGSEVGVHGWEHENLTDFSFDEQRIRLLEGKNIIETILDLKTNLLVPPMFRYNQDTIGAMEDVGYEIVSGLIDFHEFGWVSEKIKSVPGTVELSIFLNDQWQMKSVNQIILELEESVELYGCAVLVTHPQEFYLGGEFDSKVAQEFEQILEEISKSYSFNTIEGLELFS